jgi:hypothetical protein
LIARDGNHFTFGPASSDQSLKGVYYQKQGPLEATSETTADRLIEDSGESTHLISQAVTLTDAVHTFSVYVKQGVGSRNMSLRATSTSVTASAIFGLSAGKISFSSGDQLETAFIENVGPDWYRCSISFDAAAESTTLAIYINSGFDAVEGSYTGDGASALDLYAAQLEISPYPTAHTQTGLGTNTGYKNLLKSSTEFDNATSWTVADTTVSADAAAPPLEIASPTQNWYTLNAPEVLLYGSLLEAESFIMNDERLPIWRSLYDDAVRTLIEEEGNSAVSDGSLYVRSINAA